MFRLCGNPLVLIMIFAAATSVDAAPYCGNCIQRQANLRNRPRNKLLSMDWDGVAFRRQGDIVTLAKPSNPNDPKNTPNNPRTRKCCPYDFDRNFCRVLDDRLLCGYNKNIGMPESKQEIFKVTDNCRIRGGRLECGYEQPPYDGIRRPSARDNENPHDKFGRKDPDDPNSGFTPKYLPPVPQCVEMDDRIVCKPL